MPPAAQDGPVRLDVQVGKDRLVARSRPLVMGVLNVTPDSFSDGGRHVGLEDALARALTIKKEGADVLDVGGESTRPGARAVPVSQELDRVVPVIRHLVQERYDVPICVDTRRAQVAAAALDAGAGMVNDVSGLADPEMAALLAGREVPVVLMHMRGEPATMQLAPEYTDVVQEVMRELESTRDAALAAGIRRERIILDPGIGFGKRTGQGVEDNVTLLSGLPRFAALGQPLLVGASRKAFIGNLTGAPVQDRLPGSLVAAMAAVWGGASVIRVHDVAATVQAVRLAAHLDPGQWDTRWVRPDAS